MEDGYLEEFGEDGEGALFVVHALAVGLVEFVGLVARQERAGRMLEVGPQPDALIFFLILFIFHYLYIGRRGLGNGGKNESTKD